MLSVVLARFVWIIHPVLPPVLGPLGLRPRTFILLDLPAVLLWALLYGAFGHIAAGVWVRQSMRSIEAIALVAIALIVLLVGNHLRRNQPGQ